MKNTLIILNGFLHDFSAGIWLAAMTAIGLLHSTHSRTPSLERALNDVEHTFLWISLAAMCVILATGAGRTFTYVDNWYGKNAEGSRRRLLAIKHILLFLAFGMGYVWAWGKVFH